MLMLREHIGTLGDHGNQAVVMGTLSDKVYNTELSSTKAGVVNKRQKTIVHAPLKRKLMWSCWEWDSDFKHFL